MANIIKNKSRGNSSYRVTLPKEYAESYIKNHGTEIEIIPWGEGFKLSPKGQSNEKLWWSNKHLSWVKR